MQTLLGPIAETTIQNEPECLAYAWFKSDADNEVPDRYLRGIEVYKNPDALAVTHRSSEEYKRMRSSMIPAKITEEPTDLRPLKPAGLGFLSRREETDDFSQDENRSHFLVVRRHTPQAGRRDDLKAALGEVIRIVESSGELLEQVRTFWVLEYDAGLNDQTLVTVERYINKESYNSANAVLADAYMHMHPFYDMLQTTRWMGSGIGFIRGVEK